MIRTRLLLKRDELFNWLQNPDIVKIEMNNYDNRRLKNKTICDCDVYHRTSVGEIHSILGNCAALVKESDTVSHILSPKDHSFLNGFQTQKTYGYLTRKMVKQLLKIEEDYNVKLNISKRIRNIVSTYSTENIK
jgi:ribosomal protein S17E